MTRILMTIAAGLLAVADFGCATCKTPPPFYLTLEADDLLNPNEEGKSLTTRVLVLQLKDLEALRSADFNEVRKNPAAILGDALVGTPEELMVNPGEAESRWLKREKDAQYVATLAIFQLPSKSWWASHPLGSVSMFQCREVTPESLKRRPWSSEEQMRFYLRGSEIVTEQPPRSDRATPPRLERGS